MMLPKHRENTTNRPKGTKKGVQPQAFAFTKEGRLTYIKSWKSWLTQYERASARLRNGVVEALKDFPEGVFRDFSPSSVRRS